MTHVGLAAVMLIALIATSITAQTTALKRRATSAPHVTASNPQLPLSFEPNVGQTHRDVKFLSRAAGYVLFLTGTETVVASGGVAPLRFNWVGSNPRATVTGQMELPGKSHYYRGKDRRKWRTSVPHYSAVRYANLYRGVDLIYYGTAEGRVEFDLIVAAGADPASIELAFDPSERLEIDRAGNLIVSSRESASAARPAVTLHKPRIYQDRDGVRNDVEGHYMMRDGNHVGFRVGSYDRDRPLVIDPVLTLAYSTFLGGSGNDRALALAVDDAGNAVITGNTNSINFPTANAAQPTAAGGDDHFVAKISANGSTLVYSTYIGGSEGEGSNQGAVALDASGNAYIAGSTFSADFPTTPGAYQTALQNPNQGFGSFDGYIVKLNGSGALVYATLLGGTFFDAIYEIDVDSAGAAYVTGTTQSNDFPTQNAIKATQDDSFVTKLNAAGSALVYSTYFGGNHHDIPEGIAVDASGNAYVTGLTRSSDFPVVNAVQSIIDPTECSPGVRCGDAFLTKINAAGSGFVYSTYLGGNERDRGNDVEVDAFGAAYLVGDTLSTNFPTQSPLQASKAGAEDLFIAKFGPGGSSLAFSTYLGGSAREGTGFSNDHLVGAGIAVDGAGDVYVAGVTRSADFPSVDAFQGFILGGPTDAQAFVVKLNAAGSALAYSTAINPPQDMSAQADVGIDLVGGAYIAGGVAGGGTFGGYPTTANAVQPAYGGGPYDAFVAKLTHFTSVTIDIKPNSSPNTINLGSGGTAAVAILSSATFDATTVDPLTVTLASAPVKLKGNGTPQVVFQDVNGDGRQDVVIHLQTEALQLSENDTQAVLEGETFGGVAIVGTDLVRIVP
ncbi:MAG: SBBP repeat-containing protein [Vicinamibacterales bacterium]